MITVEFSDDDDGDVVDDESDIMMTTATMKTIAMITMTITSKVKYDFVDRLDYTSQPTNQPTNQHILPTPSYCILLFPVPVKSFCSRN